METFSLNQFLSSGWGTVLSVILFLAAVGATLAVSASLAVRLADRGQIASALGFGLPFALAVVLIGKCVPSPYGDPTSLEVVEVGEGLVLRAGFTYIASGGRAAGVRKNTVHTFRMEDGRRLGSRITGGAFLDRCSPVYDNRAVRICMDGRMEVRDALTFARRGALAPLLDERVPTSPWRVEHIRDDVVTVLAHDGTSHAFGLVELLGPEAARRTVIRDLLATGACFADARWDDGASGTLLRASTVRAPGRSSDTQPCVYPAPGGAAHLVLHRTTAFDDGEHLLSATPVDGGPSHWTTSLRPWVSDRSRDVRLLDPRVREDGLLEAFLLRDEASLVELVVDLGDGRVVSSKVIF